MVDQARLGSSAQFLSGHNCREPEHGARIARAHRARRARLGIPEEKVCKGCGRTFTRSEVPRQPLVHWLAREHCSFTCAHGPPVEPRVCARDGCEQIFKPSWNGDPSLRHCSVSCAQQDRFEAGDVAEAFVEHMPGRSRQRWGGRWNATKPPAPGARRRGRPGAELTAEQRDEIQRLAGRGWGRRAIANQLLLSERAVRNVLTP
jgi:hypothetical protein